MSHRFEVALSLDFRGSSIEALDAYLELDRCSGLIEPAVNAAFIAWELTDPGFSAEFQLPASAVRRYSALSRNLLSKVAKEFPDDVEPWFWRRYFDVMDLGDDDFAEECLERVRGASTAIPWFYLAGQIEDCVTDGQLRTILEHCLLIPTQKNRYVAHMVRWALSQDG